MNMQPGTPENKLNQPNESSTEQLTDLEYENKAYNLKQEYIEVMKKWNNLNHASEEIIKEYRAMQVKAHARDEFDNLWGRNTAIEKEKDRVFEELRKVWFASNRADIDLEN